MSSKISNNKISIVDCIKKLSKAKLNKLYNEIPKEIIYNQSYIKDEDKIDYIVSNILSKLLLHSMLFTEGDFKQIKMLAAGEKVENINPIFIEENFIFKEEDKYIVPEEIEELCNALSPKVKKEKLELAISFYLSVNGILSIKKLINLLGITGISTSKNAVLSVLKKENYIIKKDLIYFNQIAYDLNKEMNLYNLKEQSDYKYFSLEEILKIYFDEMSNSSQEKIEKIIKKKVDKKLLSEVSKTIYDFIIIGVDYKEKIESYLDENNIKFTSKEKTKFDNLIDEMYMTSPNWTLNGYSEEEIQEYQNLDIDSLPDDERAIAYIEVYISLNGVMDIKTLKNILSKEHNISLSKKVLLDIINSLFNIYQQNNYISLLDFESDEIESIMKIKNEIGKYKIIGDIYETLEYLNNQEVKLDLIAEKYKLSDELLYNIQTVIFIKDIDEVILDYLIKQTKTKISSKNKKNLLNELIDYSKDLRMWTLNGFTKKELAKDIK